MRGRGRNGKAATARSVRLVGADALLARYAAAMTQADMAVEMGAADAAAFGLWRIAQHASLVSTVH